MPSYPTMLSYTERTEFPTPSKAAQEEIAQLAAVDIRRGHSIDSVRKALLAAGWIHHDAPLQHKFYVDDIIRAAQKIAAKLPKETKEEIAQHATQMLLSGVSGKPFEAEGSLEPLVAEFIHGILMYRLREEDLQKLRADLSEMPSSVRGKEVMEREYRAYVGVPDIIVPYIKRIYFNYPEKEFAFLAKLFHKLNVPLMVRPKDTRKTSKAAKGLGPDQWGVSGKIMIQIPNDKGDARAVDLALDIHGVSEGEMLEISNVKVAISILLLFHYQQEESYGPQWRSEEEKREMYEKYDLLHLL